MFQNTAKFLPRALAAMILTFTCSVVFAQNSRIVPFNPNIGPDLNVRGNMSAETRNSVMILKDKNGVVSPYGTYNWSTMGDDFDPGTRAEVKLRVLSNNDNPTDNGVKGVWFQAVPGTATALDWISAHAKSIYPNDPVNASGLATTMKEVLEGNKAKNIKGYRLFTVKFLQIEPKKCDSRPLTADELTSTSVKEMQKDPEFKEKVLCGQPARFMIRVMYNILGSVVVTEHVFGELVLVENKRWVVIPREYTQDATDRTGVVLESEILGLDRNVSWEDIGKMGLNQHLENNSNGKIHATRRHFMTVQVIAGFLKGMIKPYGVPVTNPPTPLTIDELLAQPLHLQAHPDVLPGRNAEDIGVEDLAN